MTKEIVLSGGQICLVDDGDYEFLNKWIWRIHSNGYAVRNTTVNGKPICVSMARLIMDAPIGLEVDHKNLNKLDNQRNNLRLATLSQNQHNRPGFPGTSQYKGVRKHPRSGKWEVRIRLNNVQYFIGSFADESEAARAHDEAAIRLHGEFAYLNFPELAGA